MGSTSSEGSCLARVRARREGEAKSVMRIARFVLASPARARELRITDLAKACRTSPSTVSRFARTLGYAGYREFQLDLAATLVKSGKEKPDYFEGNLSPETVVRHVFASNSQSLAETEKLLDRKTVIRAAEAIRRAGKALFLGLGSSAPLADIAASRLTSLGITAIAEHDPYGQIFATASVGRGDVVVGISHSGRTAHIVEGIEAARRRGALTVAITNYPKSRVARAADLRLITAFREHRFNTAVSSSCTAQMCVIDCLYFVLAGRRPDRAGKLAEEADRRAERLLR